VSLFSLAVSNTKTAILSNILSPVKMCPQLAILLPTFNYLPLPLTIKPQEPQAGREIQTLVHTTSVMLPATTNYFDRDGTQSENELHVQCGKL